jgi:hypothetical protein
MHIFSFEFQDSNQKIQQLLDLETKILRIIEEIISNKNLQWNSKHILVYLENNEYNVFDILNLIHECQSVFDYLVYVDPKHILYVVLFQQQANHRHYLMYKSIKNNKEIDFQLKFI